MYFDNVA